MMKKRNYGIDLLRLVSMLMVVMLHCLSVGGVLDKAAPLTLRGEVMWGLEILCYCAVNCYALISGYVGYCSSGQKWSSLISLSLQVVFWAVALTATEVVVLFVTNQPISISLLVSHLFPSIKAYWYFSAYFCLFFFLPFLNDVILHSSPMALRNAAIFSLLVFCGWTQLRDGVSGIQNGYGFLWLALLYVVGGCIAKYNLFEKWSIARCFLGYFLCCMITILWKVLVGGVTLSVFGTVKGSALLLSYTSPTIVFAAIFLVVAFSKMNFESKEKAKGMISLFAPMSFSVYLIHCHPFVAGSAKNLLIWLLDLPLIVSVPLVFLIAFFVFAACLALDWVRVVLFRVLQVKKMVAWIETIGSAMMTRWFPSSN